MQQARWGAPLWKLLGRAEEGSLWKPQPLTDPAEQKIKLIEARLRGGCPSSALSVRKVPGAEVII